MNAFSEIEHSVSELREGGKQIMEAPQEINDVTSQVHQGSSEIHRGIETTNGALTAIRDHYREVAAGITNITAKASDMVDSMKRLKAIGNELSMMSEALASQFNQFRTD